MADLPKLPLKALGRMTATRFRIGEVVKRTGLSADAIRYYERRGLLARPARTHTGYRLFCPADIRTLNVVLTARAMGFSLRDIRALLTLRSKQKGICGSMRELLQEKLTAIRRDLTRLRQLESEVQGYLARCDAVLRQRQANQQCPVLDDLESLLDEGEGLKAA